MAIKLNDKKSEALQASLQGVFTALASDNEEEIKAAVGSYSEVLAEDMKDQASREISKYQTQNTDEQIMARRGSRKVLTSKEKKFFAEAVTKQKIDGLDEVFPTTIIEDVMTNLTTEHPLLSAIDTRYTEAAIKFIYGDPAEQTAFWDVIPADIRQILIGAFKTLDLSASKLSGFIALPKGYFQLGPSWLANYVITFLNEVMSATLEEAIVNGDGKHKPIGLNRKLSGATDGVYPLKDTVAITELTPKAFAGPRALLARNKMINGQISFLVNPVTYETKVSPNLFFQNTNDGTWKQLPLPNGENVIQSYAVPEGKAILGNLKNYLLAVAGNTEIKSYDQTLAIEDMDLYIAKFFGMGIAKNPNAFVVLDLGGITGVTVPNDEAEATVVAQDNFSPRANAGSHALDAEGNATGAAIGDGTGGTGGTGETTPTDPEV